MDRFSRNSQVSNLMKTRPAAAELFHATDRRTDGIQRDRQTKIQTENAKLMVLFAILQGSLQLARSHNIAVRRDTNRKREANGAFRNFAREPTISKKSQYCCRAKRSTRMPIRTLRQAGQVELLQFSSNTKFDYNYTFYFSELTFNVHVLTLTTS